MEDKIFKDGFEVGDSKKNKKGAVEVSDKSPLFSSQQPIGYLVIGDLQIQIYNKPNRFHRFMQRIILGIKYEPL